MFLSMETTLVSVSMQHFVCCLLSFVSSPHCFWRYFQLHTTTIYLVSLFLSLYAFSSYFSIDHCSFSLYDKQPQHSSLILNIDFWCSFTHSFLTLCLLDLLYTLLCYPIFIVRLLLNFSWHSKFQLPSYKLSRSTFLHTIIFIFFNICALQQVTHHSQLFFQHLHILKFVYSFFYF